MMKMHAKPLTTSAGQALEELYNRITGDEDARVCKDIPEAACNDQPHNFFAYLGANLLGKVADEIASAKLVIPWMFGTLGVPATFTGFLVPIREAGVLLPQLAVAAAVRRLAIRKGVWLLGAVLSALSLLGMAAAAVTWEGIAAGGAIVLMLVLFSLARGLCSVSAKDVLGKTVSKSRRGILMGWSASLSGIVILAVGLWLGAANLQTAGLRIFEGLLIAAGMLWILAALLFATIKEQPGATEGGGNALSVALEQLQLIVDDAPFRRYLLARALLLSVALASPFYVLRAQQYAGSGLMGLGALIIANGLATSGISILGLSRRQIEPYRDGGCRRRSRRARACHVHRSDPRLGLGYERAGAGTDLSGTERHARRGAAGAQGLSGRHGRERQPSRLCRNLQHVNRHSHAGRRANWPDRRLVRGGSHRIGTQHTLARRSRILPSAS
jgi:hypothetical protein